MEPGGGWVEPREGVVEPLIVCRREALAPQAITRTEQRLLIIHLILLCVKSGLAVSASGTLLSIGTYRGEGGIQQQQLPAFYVSRLRFIFL